MLSSYHENPLSSSVRCKKIETFQLFFTFFLKHFIFFCILTWEYADIIPGYADVMHADVNTC